MAVKKGLGRGLEALFGEVSVNPDEILMPEKAEEKKTTKSAEKTSTKSSKTLKNQSVTDQVDDADKIHYLEIHKLKPNQDQPRQSFDKDKIEELAMSIKEHGVLQPIMVRKSGSGYEIVAGERRWRAAAEAGLKTVPCLVRDLTPEQNMVIALIENIQRENLNAVEEALALDKMISRFGLTQEQVSLSVGRSRPYITNALRLLKLPKEVLNLVEDGSLSAGHARAILSINDPEKQIVAAKRAVENGWSVRETEVFAGEKKQKKQGTKKPTPKNREVRDIEDELKRVLGTKVNLVMSTRKGKIEIEYYSREELDRLIDLLLSLK